MYEQQGEAPVFDTADRAVPGELSAVKTSRIYRLSRQQSTSRVAVLLCTFEGSRFLEEQLDSISAQDHTDFNVWVSDDGSEDDTLQILHRYQSAWEEGKLSIHFGPQKGVASNFLSLLCNTEVQADYYAFADQDDIWEPDKLSRAISILKQIPNDIPVLYCSRTRLIDYSGRDIGIYPLFNKQPSFANALVQNIAGGNTMVMNKAARELLRSAGERTVVHHDWWTYLIITGAGGMVFNDPCATVHYRQHNNNQIGSNHGWLARATRFKLLLHGRFRTWNTIHTESLQDLRNLLTTENQRILNDFIIARQRWLIPRIWGMKKAGIYHQTFLGNIRLIAAALLNRL